MRKAILYIIFIGLLFTNAISARSIEMGRTAAVKTAVQKEENISADSLDIFRRHFSFHKDDELNDFDDDFDESDHDDPQASVKYKLLFVNSAFLTFNSPQTDCTCKPFCNKAYAEVNISRLPRFNYISLRVLRI